MKDIDMIVQEIRDEYIHTEMEVGKTLRHPDGRLVKIIDGCLYDPTYNRLSNWWDWKEIKKDGSLGKMESGYGW